MNVEVAAPADLDRRLLQVIELLDGAEVPSSADLAEAATELRALVREWPGRRDAAQQAALDVADQPAVVQRLRYQQLFDNAPDGYLVLDRFGAIVEANNAA